MSFESWDEIRTAYHVARLGTVSGAAEVLGVHHATVIRHIDALEARLGVKLFQRHARGYTATEAGQDLLRVAQATDAQLAQLSGRLSGQDAQMAGELVVTSVDCLAWVLTPLLVGFQHQNPALRLRYLSNMRLFRLEYGEAHVAIRAGAMPDQPDNVVQPFMQHSVALYASRAYCAAHGQPKSEADLASHRFVAQDDATSRAPFLQWLHAQVPPQAITFRATETAALHAAILAGAGIGFLPVADAADQADLVQVMAPRDEWRVQLWLVTHVDLHRTPKVQALLGYLKAAARIGDPR